MAYKYRGYEISLVSHEDCYGRCLTLYVKAEPVLKDWCVDYLLSPPSGREDYHTVYMGFEFQTLWAPTADTVEASYEHMKQLIDEEHERCLEETGHLPPAAQQ